MGTVTLSGWGNAGAFGGVSAGALDPHRSGESVGFRRHAAKVLGLAALSVESDNRTTRTDQLDDDEEEMAAAYARSSNMERHEALAADPVGFAKAREAYHARGGAAFAKRLKGLDVESDSRSTRARPDQQAPTQQARDPWNNDGRSSSAPSRPGVLTAVANFVILRAMDEDDQDSAHHYDRMTNMQRHELLATNPRRFAELRACWLHAQGRDD